MKIMSMNIRGFRGLPKQKSLSSIFSDLNPDMILIQEKMCNFSQALFLFSKIKPGLEYCSLDSASHSVGLLAS